MKIREDPPKVDDDSKVLYAPLVLTYTSLEKKASATVGEGWTSKQSKAKRNHRENHHIVQSPSFSSSSLSRLSVLSWRLAAPCFFTLFLVIRDLSCFSVFFFFLFFMDHHHKISWSVCLLELTLSFSPYYYIIQMRASTQQQLRAAVGGRRTTMSSLFCKYATLSAIIIFCAITSSVQGFFLSPNNKPIQTYGGANNMPSTPQFQQGKPACSVCVCTSIEWVSRRKKGAGGSKFFFFVE